MLKEGNVLKCTRTVKLDGKKERQTTGATIGRGGVGWGGRLFDSMKNRGSQVCQTIVVPVVRLYLDENGVEWYES